MAGRNTEEAKRQIILAAGVFDLLHLGHVRFLEEAKKVAGENGELVVIVARDKTVEQRKGEKPVMSENQRRALVESLKVVDEAVLGYEEFNIEDVIMKIRPDIVVLGHDQENIGQLVKRIIRERGLKTKIQKIGKFSEDELNSSSEIKRKIVELYRRLQ